MNTPTETRIPAAAVKLIAKQALAFLANKHGMTAGGVAWLITNGHTDLRAQMQELGEVGRAQVLRLQAQSS